MVILQYRPQHQPYLDTERDDVLHDVFIQGVFLQVVFQCLGEVSAILQLDAVDDDGPPGLACHGPGHGLATSVLILLAVQDRLQGLNAFIAVVGDVKNDILNILWLLP